MDNFIWGKILISGNRFSSFAKSLGGMGKFFCLFSLCFFLVVSCGKGSQTTISTTKVTSGDGGRITVGTTLRPRTLDPADAYEVQSLVLVYNMSDRLYTYKSGSTELQPQLATALPKVSPDGLTYTIPIRQGVVFHDGTPFNAKAMEFSIQRFLQNGGKPSFLLKDVVDSVKATSEQELTIKLKKTFAAFPALLAFPGVCAVSPKAYELGAGKFQPSKFVGTGPYKLTQYGTDLVRLDVFDKYWGEKPLNQGINWQILSSPANLFNAFRTKAVDVAYVSLEPIQIKTLQEGAKKGDWQAIAAQGSAVKFMALNRNQKPLDNPAVRQAIAALIDRSIINQRVLFNQAEPLYSMVPTTFNVYKPVFKEKYGDGNINQAKQLLTAAGFSQSNPAKIQIWHSSTSPTSASAAQTIKAIADKNMEGMLQFEINPVESATFFKDISKGLYPISIFDWYPDFLDPDNYIQPFLECSKGSLANGCEEGASKTQGSFYYNPKVNQLIAQERQEQNPKNRQKIFTGIQAQVAIDVPYIPLWQSKDYVFAQNGLKGVQLDPSQFLIYKTIQK